MRMFLRAIGASALAMTAAASAGATTIDFAWNGVGGYSATGNFTYDGATAPTVITERGAGATSVLQSFSISFLDPAMNVLESGSEIVNGVSSDRFLNFVFNTATQAVSVLDADIGGASYLYFLTDLRTPTGGVVPAGQTGFNLFDRRRANAALDSAPSVSIVQASVPEPSGLLVVLVGGVALALHRRSKPRLTA